MKNKNRKLAPIERTLLKGKIMARMKMDPEFAKKVNKMIEEKKAKGISFED